MQVGREHKRYLVDPEAHCSGFWLFFGWVIIVGRKKVGKVSVEVEAVRVSAPVAVLTLALGRHLESVRVHRGHQVDARVLEQVLDVLVGWVRVDQVDEQLEQEFAADDLVAVHVGDVLDVGLEQLVVVVRVLGDQRHPKLAPLDGLADGVDAHQFREGVADIVQQVGHGLVVVVGELDGGRGPGGAWGRLAGLVLAGGARVLRALVQLAEGGRCAGARVACACACGRPAVSVGARAGPTGAASRPATHLCRCSRSGSRTGAPASWGPPAPGPSGGAG